MQLCVANFGALVTLAAWLMGTMIYNIQLHVTVECRI